MFSYHIPSWCWMHVGKVVLYREVLCYREFTSYRDDILADAAERVAVL